MVRELERRADRGNDYLHPTVLVGLWRDPHTRLKLRLLLREGLKIQQTDFTWQDVLAWLQFAADHERQHRELLMANLLANLAEQAMRPDECYVAKVASRAREAGEEWRASQVLHAAELPNQAEEHMRRALFHPVACAKSRPRVDAGCRSADPCGARSPVLANWVFGLRYCRKISWRSVESAYHALASPIPEIFIEKPINTNALALTVGARSGRTS
jgi:hypothetical protein